MRALLMLMIAAAVVAGPTRCTWLTRECQVSGEMFVVTGGRENVRLGDTEVRLYEYATLLEHIKKVHANLDEKRALVASEKARLGSQPSTVDQDAAEAYAEKLIAADLFLSMPMPYFDGLPEPSLKTRTDATGAYHFTVHADGQYVIVAMAQRNVFGPREHYFWMVPVDPRGTDNQTINLANENMTTGKSDGTLIHTMPGVAAEDGAAALHLVEETARKQREIEKTRHQDADILRRAREAEAESRLPFSEQVQHSQIRAVKNYPDLGRAVSPLNQLFIRRLNEWKKRVDPRLAKPNWPEVLADDCASHP